MRNFLTFFFLIPLSSLPQSTSFDFHSSENIRKFADHLFCEGDYLRAIEQYKFIQNQFVNDTIEFNILFAYSELGLYQESQDFFEGVNAESIFYPDAYLLSLKNELITETKFMNDSNIKSFNSSQMKSFSKLNTISMLYADEISITREKFILPFDEDEQNSVSSFYDYKIEPPYKNPTLAGILSAIVPGSGKMYVGEWGDGITAFLATGLLAFLAYDNFQS